MKSIIILSALAGSAMANTFSTSLYYGDDFRCNQPIFMSAIPSSTSCEATSTTCVTAAGDKLDSRYKATKIACTEDPISLVSNKIRDYVTVSSYTGAQCSGTPTSVLAYAVDDKCHPSLTNKGKFMRANCNGEKPYVLECSDNKCEECTRSDFTLGCINGGTQSVQCIRGSSNGGFIDGEEFSGATTQNVVVGGLAIAAMGLIANAL